MLGDGLVRMAQERRCRRWGMEVMRCVLDPGYGKTKILRCSRTVFANKPGVARVGDKSEYGAVTSKGYLMVFSR